MALSCDYIKPYMVAFIDGPCNGVTRYYSTFYNAKRAARRYVLMNRIPGRFIFTYPSCEIFYIYNNGVSRFLTLVTHK